MPYICLRNVWNIHEVCIWYIWLMPQIRLRSAQYMPEICVRYAWDMHKIGPIFGWELPEIRLKFAIDLPKKYMKYAWDMLEICLRYTWDMPEICLRYAWDMPEIWLRYSQDMTERCTWLWLGWNKRRTWWEANRDWVSDWLSDEAVTRDTYASKKCTFKNFLSFQDSLTPQWTIHHITR